MVSIHSRDISELFFLPFTIVFTYHTPLACVFFLSLHLARFLGYGSGQGCRIMGFVWVRDLKHYGRIWGRWGKEPGKQDRTGQLHGIYHVYSGRDSSG